MKRLAPLARALAIALAFAAAPAVAQDRSAARDGALPAMPRFADEAPLSVGRRGFSFPIIEYTEPGGARVQRRGIILGKEVAPGALVGVGMLEFVPRSQGYSANPESAPKRKRRAAVGLSIRF